MAPSTYVPNFTRLQLGTLTGSVVKTDEVVDAMIATGNDDVYVPGISDAAGAIVELRTKAPGSGYTDGSYNGVSLIDTGTATGLFATIDIQWLSGSIAFVIIQNGGQDYKKGDLLTVDSADVGGTGSGLVFEVVLVQPD